MQAPRLHLTIGPRGRKRNRGGTAMRQQARKQTVTPRGQRAHRARQDPRIATTVATHVQWVRFAAQLCTRKPLADFLAQHLDRCSDELALALHLTREWALSSAGPGGSRGSGTPDPTGAAATRTHATAIHAKLLALMLDGPTLPADACNRCRAIEALLAAVDPHQRREQNHIDRAKMHADNIGQGHCTICARYTVGSASDRLRTLASTAHVICETCRRAWVRLPHPKPDPQTWADSRANGLTCTPVNC